MMLNHLKNTTNQTTTTNGDTAYHSTLNAVLDLFGRGGSLREDLPEFVRLFDKALAESDELAVKTLFYIRDIRGGQGERDVFRVAFRHLAEVKREKVEHLIPLVAEYGRFDDLFVLFDTPLEEKMKDFIFKQLLEDLEKQKEGKSVSQLAKWLPSENASSKKTRALAKRFIKAFEQTPVQYRKMLVTLRKHINLVETHLSNGVMSDIVYENVPSRAQQKYTKAFYRRDEERYSDYISAVQSGEKKINASTLYPYDIVHRVFSSYDREELRTMDALWNALPDFTEGNQDNSLVVVDVSGSMMGSAPNAPIHVAIGLGLYIAERNVGQFHNHFLTFSQNPHLVEVKGTSVEKKIMNMRRSDWGYNTNLGRTFDVILKTAVTNNLPKAEMVKRLIIISDMQFDEACESNSGRVIDVKRKAFEEAGYDFPEIIFWNVNGNGTVPITHDERGVALVSGSSPSVLKSILASKDISPIQLMLEVLERERYAPITLNG